MERVPVLSKEVELKRVKEIKEVAEIKQEIEEILSATGKIFREKLGEKRREKVKLEFPLAQFFEKTKEKTEPPNFVDELKNRNH